MVLTSPVSAFTAMAMSQNTSATKKSNSEGKFITILIKQKRNRTQDTFFDRIILKDYIF